MISADFLAEAGGVLAHDLSDGRRSSCRLITGPEPRFGTDLRTVFVPFDAADRPSDLRAMTCGIALQASPTKEIVAEVRWEGLTGRQRDALLLVESGAALAWTRRRWPGLTERFSAFLPDLEPMCPEATAEEMLRLALDLARRGQVEPPPLLGGLPRALTPVSAVATLRRRWSSRLPWSHPELLSRRSSRSIGVGGAGAGGERLSTTLVDGHHGDDSPCCSVPAGLPYDEWDGLTCRYRIGHVTVFENTAAPPSGLPVPAPRPEVMEWFRNGLDRVRRRHLEDGDDLDLDSYVHDHCLRRRGESTAGLVYAAYGLGPRDVATALLLDGSGSLSAHHARALATQLACADALIAGLAESNEPHGVFAFWGDTRHRVEIQTLRAFTDRGRRPLRTMVRPRGYTRLGAPIRHLTRRLLDVPAARRILLAIGDGLPSDEGYEGRYAVLDVEKAVAEATAEGIMVFYVAVGSVTTDPLPEMFGGERSMRIADVKDLPRALAAVNDALRAQ